jgi:hypothetical protein
LHCVESSQIHGERRSSLQNISHSYFLLAIFLLVILLLTYCGEGTGGRKGGGKSDKAELHFDLLLFDCSIDIMDVQLEDIEWHHRRRVERKFSATSVALSRRHHCRSRHPHVIRLNNTFSLNLHPSQKLNHERFVPLITHCGSLGYRNIVSYPIR